jgi:hypothetical protein
MVLFNTQIDSGDLTHAYYTQDNRVLLGDKELHHRTLSLGGVVGAENIIDSALVDIDRITIGRCSQFTTLFVPVIYFLGSLPPLAKVWVSNGIGSTPTWTLEVVDTAPVVTAGGEDAELYSLVSNDTLTLYIFWIALDYTDPTNVIDRLYYASSTDGINWSLPILMYDAVTNPQLEDPTILDTNQDIHTLSISQLLDGTFGISTALEENGFCAGYALIDGASTCVITTIPATISGTVTLPPQPITQAHYSSPLIAFEFGGETFSYEITSPQQLPDGLHMQNNTGTQVSQTGPIVVNDGILIAGTPTYSEYQTPVVTTVAMQLRLTV